MLAGEFKLIGITGNQQARTGPFVGLDETLYEISYAIPGQPTPPALLDGFEDVKPNPPDTVLSVSTSVGVTQGSGSLRVDVPQGQGAFWGFRTGNIVDQLKAGATKLSYDMTLTNVELNGGSYGGGADNSFNGFAQVNEIAVVIAAPSGGFIQRNFAAGGATDSSTQAGQWNGIDGTRNITWDLTQFTSNGMSLSEFITSTGANEARIWFPTQGGDSNGNVGPMRFYFDNMVLTAGLTETLIGDFEPLSIKPLIKLPFVPDTDAIGFNPDNGLLYRTSGASSYRDNPNRIGYQDNHFMQTVNPFNPTEQAGVFNATPEGENDTIDGVVVPTGPYGLPAPRPNFVLPATRRTPQQTDSSFGDMFGPGEYHAARDLAWSSTEKLFYVADETGIYKLTPTGQSTFVGRPAGNPGEAGEAAGEDDLKGLTFFTIDGQRRLLATERADSNTPWNLFTIDPATGQKIGEPVMLTDASGTPLGGVLSLEATPDGTTLFGITQGDGGPFARELITINPVTGMTTRLGNLGIHMADLAFVVAPPFRVSGSEFVYQTAPPRLRVTFDRDVNPATLTADDLSVQRLPGGTAFNATEVSYDPTTRTATFTLSATPLADGNYRATLAQGAVTGADGSELTPSTADFFVFAGDTNRDRQINFTDLVALAQNYGGTGKTFPEGDFNYDGNVNFTDLVILAQKYGSNLPGPAAELLAAEASPVTASVSSARSGPTKRREDQVFNTRVPIKKPAPAPKVSRSAGRR